MARLRQVRAPKELPIACTSLSGLMMTALERQAARPLCVRPLGCASVDGDEVRLVYACGLCFVRPDLAQGLLAGVVTGALVVTAVLRAVNGRLRLGGLQLSAASPRPMTSWSLRLHRWRARRSTELNDPAPATRRFGSQS